MSQACLMAVALQLDFKLACMPLSAANNYSSIRETWLSCFFLWSRLANLAETLRRVVAQVGSEAGDTGGAWALLGLSSATAAWWANTVHAAGSCSSSATEAPPAPIPVWLLSSLPRVCVLHACGASGLLLQRFPDIQACGLPGGSSGAFRHEPGARAPQCSLCGDAGQRLPGCYAAPRAARADCCPLLHSGGPRHWACSFLFCAEWRCL